MCNTILVNSSQIIIIIKPNPGFMSNQAQSLLSQKTMFGFKKFQNNSH